MRGMCGRRAAVQFCARAGRFVLPVGVDAVSEESGDKARWEATGELAIGVVVVAVIVALTLVLAPLFGDEVILGLPRRYLLAGLAAPVLLVLAVFWLAERQDRIDRRFDAAEE